MSTKPQQSPEERPSRRPRKSVQYYTENQYIIVPKIWRGTVSTLYGGLFNPKKRTQEAFGYDFRVVTGRTRIPGLSFIVRRVIEHPAILGRHGECALRDNDTCTSCEHRSEAGALIAECLSCTFRASQPWSSHATELSPKPSSHNCYYTAVSIVNKLDLWITILIPSKKTNKSCYGWKISRWNEKKLYIGMPAYSKQVNSTKIHFLFSQRRLHYTTVRQIVKE